MANPFDREPQKQHKPEGYETWGTRQEVKERLGNITEYKLKQLLEQTSSDGLIYIRNGAVIPAGEPTARAMGLISPDLEQRLRDLLAEEQSERATDEWLGFGELRDFIGCGDQTLTDLLLADPPQIGRTMESMERRTKERGQLTKHYNLIYAQRLKRRFDHDKTESRIPKAATPSPKAAAEPLPKPLSENERDIQTLDAAIQAMSRIIDDRIKPRTTQLDQLCQQARETRIALSGLLTQLVTGENKINLEIKKRIRTILQEAREINDEFND